MFEKMQTRRVFSDMEKNLVKVVSEQVSHNQLLIEQFQNFIKEKVEGAELTNNAILSVYSEFSRKLCNTRLNEFLDAYKQLPQKREKQH